MTKVKKRTVLKYFLLFTVPVICSCRQQAALYVGTYGSAIHVLSYDTAGKITGEQTAISADNASYLAFDSANVLFAVSEKGTDSGVYSFVNENGAWQQRSYCSEVGADPCYILPVEGESKVLTADYSGGSFSVFQVERDSVAGRVQVFDDGLHVHQAKEIPASIISSLGLKGRYFAVSDLGKSLIYVEKLSDGHFDEVCRIDCGEGSGPRHMEFNTRNNLLYCLTEISGEVIVWKMAVADGELAFAPVQRLMADPNNAHGSADIHLHPNGKWLYTSHRLVGDGITSFIVGPDGLLSKTGYTATGSHPRNFTFSPDGRNLLVACKNSRSIQVYKINSQDGTLKSLKQEYFLETNEPVCLVFEE